MLPIYITGSIIICNEINNNFTYTAYRFLPFLVAYGLYITDGKNIDKCAKIY